MDADRTLTVGICNFCFDAERGGEKERMASLLR